VVFFESLVDEAGESLLVPRNMYGFPVKLCSIICFINSSSSVMWLRSVTSGCSLSVVEGEAVVVVVVGEVDVVVVGEVDVVEVDVVVAVVVAVVVVVAVDVASNLQMIQIKLLNSKQI
jgi:hypothetical protein